MSAMEIKQSSSTALTCWMGFHAGHVSNGYQAEQWHSTHLLDGISCRPCQQWISSRAAAQHSLAGWDFMQAMSAMETKQSSSTALTTWMGFHAGHVSNGNQAEQWHSTHNLDGISCRPCQQWRSSRAAAQHSLAGWDFMQAISAMEIKQSSSTALTSWMGFHAGHVSNGHQAQQQHSTHILDGISCRPCQQWTSSREAAQHSLPGWDFMQAMSAMDIKHSSSTALTRWMGFHAGYVSNGHQAQQWHSTHSLDGISCRPCQQWISSKEAAQHSLAEWDFMQAILAMEIK